MVTHLKQKAGEIKQGDKPATDEVAKDFCDGGEMEGK